MKPVRRRALGVGSATVVMALGTAWASPASAAPVRCGAVITRSIVLAADVGPCPGTGLIVGADGITVDLGGHRLFGTPGAGDGHGAGIRLPNRRGVTVKRGTVSSFDAGVAVNRGSANTVTGIVARDNRGPADFTNAELGDGIVLFNSANNRILDNSVIHNGIFDGIGVLGLDANDNVIADNVVTDNVTEGGDAVFPGEGTGIVIDAFVDPNDPRRGESITGNRVLANLIRNNAGAGISNVSNVRGIIRQNLIEANGFGTPCCQSGNGIGVSRNAMATPITQVLVEQNAVHGNFYSGIKINTEQNRIVSNDAADNNVSHTFGIAFDLADYSVRGGCDSNVWMGNRWGSGGYFPACASVGGSGPSFSPNPSTPSLEPPDGHDGVGDPTRRLSAG